MKRILVIEASPRNGLNRKYAQEFCSKIKTYTEADIRFITVKDENIANCRGCCTCFMLGEQKCPEWGDSTPGILEQLLWAEGIAIFTPDYSLQVPAILKNLFDRLAFVFHRPRLFGRKSMVFVTQGVYGGKKIISYVDELMSFWGCTTVKGATLPGALKVSEQFTDKIRQKTDRKIDEGARRFLKELSDTRPEKPSIFRLFIFRMTRSSMKYFPEATKADREYYTEKGWLTSKYFYDVNIGPIKYLIGKLADIMMRNMAKKESKNNL